MINVGIVGVDAGHRHILHGTYELFDGENIDLTLFTTQDNRDGLEERGLNLAGTEVILARDDESYRSFLRRVASYSSTHLDLLYINTVGYRIRRYLSYVGFNPDCLLYARIYNARTWFDPTFETRDIQSLAYVNSCHLLRQALLRKLDGVVLEYPPMAKFIRERSNYRGDTIVIPILYDVPQPEEYQSNHAIRVVVPGNVQSHRRDYHFLLDTFEDLFQRHGDRFELELLGRPRDEYGQDILERCHSLSEAGYCVVTHTEWIDDDEFERGIAKSDLICSPFRPQVTGQALNAEVYGESKGSSVVGHGIRHAKPLVVPDWFRLAWNLGEYSQTYEDESTLLEMLDALATGETDVETLTSQAEAESERVRREARNRVEAWLDSID